MEITELNTGSSQKRNGRVGGKNAVVNEPKP